MQLLRSQDHRRERWRNGGGWTSEIARGHVGADRPDHAAAVPGPADDWEWRLSIADVDRDGAFSLYPGIQRTLLLLDGAGMTLRFADGEAVDLHAHGDRADFAGERPLDCELADGPTRDFNAMWRRDRVHADIRQDWISGAIDLSTADARPGVLGIHVVAGELRASALGAIAIGAGDTLLALDAARNPFCITGRRAEVLIIRFTPARIRTLL